MPPRARSQRADAALGLDKTTRLLELDTVSVAVGVFGMEYALSRGASPWTSELVRDEGKVVARKDGKWQVRFSDGAEHFFERRALSFVRRDGGPAGTRRANPIEGEDDSSSNNSDAREEAGATARRATQPREQDSSEDEFGAGEANHDVNNRTANGQPMGEWRRDDEYAVDERARHGFTDQNGPRLSGLSDWENTSLYSLALHFLPMPYLTSMAAAMQAEGLSKFAAGQRAFANWKVSTDDLIQWIGVWIYMLAFPQSGTRRAYWTEPIGSFGPRHRLSQYLAAGENGEKGVKWFEKMQACFKLPTHPNSEEDPFRLTRLWWESLRDSFFSAVSASWLLVLDESMVRWMGTGMPGLMVILRKPTPIGLELHTLCCALCGILVWFEVYEGKEAMATKEFTATYPKSIALTLRMVKPFFGSGRVLIADSWFGSVACALALFKYNLFCVMNVKTAHRDFPKDELLAVVGEIKGNSADAREQRRARRGKQIAFVRTYNVGSIDVRLTAGGHNKKVPLLLISTAKSMLPGNVHTKTWHVNKADGSIEYRSLRTPQPQMHELYRKWMNVVDLHNKLRQGVVSMADVWSTTSWAERHFSEGLGMWEVNVYKALIYFYPKCATLAHGEFRARLAWALLTLGKKPYPTSNEQPPEVGSSSSGLGIPPLPESRHHYERQKSVHRCAYCGTPAYWKCVSCESNGLGVMSVCGAKSARGTKCMEAHARGDPTKHATSYCSPTGRDGMLRMLARKRSRGASSGEGSAGVAQPE